MVLGSGFGQWEEKQRQQRDQRNLLHEQEMVKQSEQDFMQEKRWRKSNVLDLCSKIEANNIRATRLSEGKEEKGGTCVR